MKIVEKQIRRIFPRFDTKPCLVEKQEKKKERNGSSWEIVETKRDRNNRYNAIAENLDLIARRWRRIREADNYARRAVDPRANYLVSFQ